MTDSREVVQSFAEQFAMAQLIDSLGRKQEDGGMRERVAVIETTLRSLATKADVERMRNEFQEAALAVSNDVKKWTLTTSWTVIAVGVIGLFGLLFTIYNANRAVPQSAPSATQPAPIIIQMPPPPASAPTP